MWKNLNKLGLLNNFTNVQFKRCYADKCGKQVTGCSKKEDNKSPPKVIHCVDYGGKNICSRQTGSKLFLYLNQNDQNQCFVCRSEKMESASLPCLFTYRDISHSLCFRNQPPRAREAEVYSLRVLANKKQEPKLLERRNARTLILQS